MSDTVKLIIEIPQTIYEDLKAGKIYSSLCEAPQGLLEGIQNGIPLDDVKAEISEIPKKYPMTVDYESGLNEALNIIDKHISAEKDNTWERTTETMKK